MKTFLSNVEESEFNINSTGDSTITLKSNVVNISNTLDDTINNSIESTYKSTNSIIVNNQNKETYDKYQSNNLVNKEIDLHQRLNKYNNKNDTYSYNNLNVNSHTNKVQYIHTNSTKTTLNNNNITNKKDFKTVSNNRSDHIHQDYDISVEQNKHIYVENSLIETLHNNSTVHDIDNSTTNIYNSADKYSNNLNLNQYKNKQITSHSAETSEIKKQNTLHIYKEQDLTYNNQTSKCGGTSTTLNKSTYTVLCENTNHTKVNNNDSITYDDDLNINSKSNNTRSISGTYDLTELGQDNITNRKNQTLVTQDQNPTVHLEQTTYIKQDSDETYNNSNIDITGNKTETIDKYYHTTTAQDISINTPGGIQITTQTDRSLHLNSNVGITNNSIVSNVPNILNTTALSSYISVTGDESNMLSINPLHSLFIVSLNTNNTIAENYMDKDLYVRLKLQPGKSDGQHIKLVLHPNFQRFFDNVSNSNYDTIDKRTEYNLKTEVILRIESFCDANDNELVTADLILNKGGMCLNLVYVSTTTNTDLVSTNDVNHYRTDGPSNTGIGYWILLGNSFT